MIEVIKIAKNDLKKDKLKKEKRNLKVRMILVVSLITLGFVAVVANLTYITVVKGSEYKQAAYSQQTTSEVISPNRGTIYDANGEVLAVSVVVDTVSVNPRKGKIFKW